MTDLLQTVMDELPAGATLVLGVGDELPFKSRPLEGAPDRQAHATELLLDGQQRLTALWRALHDNYRHRVYFIKLPGRLEGGLPEAAYDMDGTSPIPVVAQSRYWRDGTPRPLWAHEPAATLDRGLLPIRLLQPGTAGEQELTSWLQEALGDDVSRRSPSTSSLPSSACVWPPTTFRTSSCRPGHRNP